MALAVRLPVTPPPSTPIELIPTSRTKYSNDTLGFSARIMQGFLRIYNRARNKLLVSEGQAALSFWTRLRGLLGYPPMQFGQGLWIAPCNWIHTLGMGFPIDVLYLDREGQVLHAASEMHPNRLGPLVWRANSVLELPVGVIEDSGTRVGDRLEITWAPKESVKRGAWSKGAQSRST